MRNHTGLPVTERVFLIHPALDHLIAVTSGGREFFKNFDRSNIIGNGLKWFATGASSVVLKGDVCSFSEIMTTDYYEDISKNLHEWAETACRDLEFSEVSGGDSIVMIDRSADRVIRAADAFLRLAKACPDISLTLRFGGAVGPVNYRDLMRRIDGKWEKIRIPTGLALRTSARLEPHAREGEIIVDEKFAELVRSRPNGFSIDELGKADLNHLTFDDDKQKFVVQKNAHDPGITTKLYRVTATAGSD
jgi:hypothetical protein